MGKTTIKTDCLERMDFTDMPKQIALFMASFLHEIEPNPIKTQVIREEMDAGRYQIHAHHIANKLLEYAPVLEKELMT